MGETLMARYLGKKKLIAETSARKDGVALTIAAAYFGFECEIQTGELDMDKEHPNIQWMKKLGATVIPVTHGLKILRS